MLEDEIVRPRAATSQSIRAVEIYGYSLSYVGGTYVMSQDRHVSSLDSTVVRVITEEGLVGYGETCPLGSNYLPAHSAGARAALTEVAPGILGLDAANPVGVGAAMDACLLGHGYAKSAIDIACWDVLGQSAGKPVCDLLGGRQQAEYPLYVAIPLRSPEGMSSHVTELRRAGIHRFQLKLGGDPVADAERARAVVEATDAEDLIYGDANRGWSMCEALVAVRLMEDLPRFWLEQPCATTEECARVREHTSLPMILDETIVDLQTLLAAWEARSLDGVNLKISRIGGLTRTRLLRDVAQALGLVVNIEDSWGGDLTTAAVSHLAASADPRALQMVSFMNDWTNEHIAGYEPRSDQGRGAAPAGAGLGVAIDLEMLGTPLARFGN